MSAGSVRRSAAIFCASIAVGFGAGYGLTVLREDAPESAAQQICRDIRQIDVLYKEGGLEESKITPMTRRARAFAKRVERVEKHARHIRLPDPDDDALRVIWLNGVQSTTHDLRSDETGGEELGDGSNMPAGAELRKAVTCGKR